MKNPARRAWLGMARDLLALVAASLILVSPVQAAGGGNGTGAKPKLSTKDFVYYLTGSDLNMSPPAPASQMTVLMGGGEFDVDEAFRDMIGKAGGSTTSKIDIVVIRASGADDYNPYLYAMEGVDSVQTLVIKTPAGANDPTVRNIILGADVLFIAGGDQWSYIGQWNETAVEQSIKTLLEKKVPIGGTSAGLAVLGAVDFSAQYGTISSAEALGDPYHRRLTLDRSFLETTPKLQNTIVDAHLVSRDRMGRLVTFLARMVKDGLLWSSARAIGVDNETAVVIDGDTATVRSNSGTGAAYFLKLPQDPKDTLVVEPKTPLEVSSIQVDKLTKADGSSFNMASGARTGGSNYELRVQRGVLYGPGNSPY